MKQLICLADVGVGKSARIARLNTAGAMRRRLLDIGLTENTRVCCIGKSPCGNPHAYEIRGAVIAIRNEDCKDILVYI